MDSYSDSTFETPKGNKFRLYLSYDDCGETPWENDEGHGIVSDWTNRDKKPGELVLCTDRHDIKRFYDFQESMKIAKRDDWNVAPFDGHKTKGIQAYKSVMSDFENLKDWCENKWWYAVLHVVLLDENGEETDYEEYLGGVYDGYGAVFHEFIMDCAQDKANEIEYSFESDNSEEQTNLLHSIKDNALFADGIV